MLVSSDGGSLVASTYKRKSEDDLSNMMQGGATYS